MSVFPHIQNVEACSTYARGKMKEACASKSFPEIARLLWQLSDRTSSITSTYSRHLWTDIEILYMMCQQLKDKECKARWLHRTRSLRRLNKELTKVLIFLNDVCYYLICVENRKVTTIGTEEWHKENEQFGKMINVNPSYIADSLELPPNSIWLPFIYDIGSKVSGRHMCTGAYGYDNTIIYRYARHMWTAYVQRNGTRVNREFFAQCIQQLTRLIYFSSVACLENVEWDNNWRSSTVIGLADAIHKESAFDRLPILADALEEAGCDDPHVLNMCRNLNFGFRGMQLLWKIRKEG